jgi:hypothetical protein
VLTPRDDIPGWWAAQNERVLSREPTSSRSRNDEALRQLTTSRRQPWAVHMTDDSEIAWHRELIAKNRTLLEELEAGNTAGSDVFPETQSEIERLKAQIAQSELIVAASEKL